VSGYDPFGDFEPVQPATLEEDRPPRASRGADPDLVYNAVALFFVAASIAAVLITLALINNPTLPINPFPPPTPAPTPTLFLLQPVGPAEGQVDQSAAPTPTQTPTERPTSTPDATATVTPVIAQTGTVPPGGGGDTGDGFAFVLHSETLNYTAYAGPEGCNFMAIAGQVLDQEGGPVNGIPVVVRGDQFFSALEFSGNAPQYGPSGYQVVINDSPYEADFTVKLVSETGLALSDDYVVRTSASCEENIVIANFVAAPPGE
jgi:hypothetical protein